MLRAAIYVERRIKFNNKINNLDKLVILLSECDRYKLKHGVHISSRRLETEVI